MNARGPLGRFVLRTFLWLPLCFAGWYAAAPVVSAAGAGAAAMIVHGFAPGVLATIERPGRELAFVTTLAVEAEPGRMAVLVPEVNPLAYTYGLALFLALMLGARARAWKIAVGAVLLVPFHGWGIAFDFLAHVGINLGAAVSAQAGLGGWRKEFIALAYQLGTLVLPSLAPVMLWAAFNREFMATIGKEFERPDDTALA